MAFFRHVLGTVRNASALSAGTAAMIPPHPLRSSRAEKWRNPRTDATMVTEYARHRVARDAAAASFTGLPPPHGDLRPASSTNPPIVVDLDGTLVATDTLAESVLQLVKTSPARIAALPLWLASGKAGFKQALAKHSQISVATLPYNRELLDFLREEKANGRRIILATAAHKSIARRVAEHLEVFDDVIATSGGDNLKGERKLAAIEALVGNQFVYIGDHAADLPIWQRAQQAMLVAPRSGAGARLRREVTFAREFYGEGRVLPAWLHALRVHQWVKNLLIFVPLLTSFGFLDPGHVFTTACGFLIFSVAASANYILNDLFDLDSDRAHPRKRNRAFASGRIGVLHGAAVALCLLALALTAAPILSLKFALVLVAYLFITVTYSLALKRYVLIDVLTLGLLYTLRIIAGAAVIGVVMSPWLLAFSVFLFISLALVKRCSELVSLERAGRTSASGRDYQVSDLAVLWPLGIGTTLAAVVVFGLFINAPDTQVRYLTPNLLWLVAFGLTYWLGRLWIKTLRGEMHDDPILFAARDGGSRVAIGGMVLVTLAAHRLVLDGLGW